MCFCCECAFSKKKIWKIEKKSVNNTQNSAYNLENKLLLKLTKKNLPNMAWNLEKKLKKEKPSAKYQCKFWRKLLLKLKEKTSAKKEKLSAKYGVNF